MKVSIIIPAHNEEKYIVRTLKSIINQSINKKHYEIIVCDDASTDKTFKLSKKYADKVIKMEKCKSIGQVRNKGAEQADSDVLLFIDGDTIISPGLLSDSLRFLKKKNVQAVLFEYSLSSNSPLIKVGGFLFNLLNKILLRINQKLVMVSGSCMLVKKNAFKKVGGFNESLIFNEDKDLINKVGELGRIIILRDKVVTSDRRMKKMGLIKYFFWHIDGFIKYYSDNNYEGDYEIIR